MQKTDFIIIGQGICGTLLSYELIKRNRSVIVIDDGNPAASSKVASGLINPVTGKRHVTSWMYDTFLETALHIYTALEDELNIEMMRSTEIIHFYKDEADRSIFTSRSEEEDRLIADAGAGFEKYFNYSWGTGKIAPCYIVNARPLLQAWREKLKLNNLLREEHFDEKQCTVSDMVYYKNLKARKIIFCDGVASTSNPYFSLLPFSRNKGEALIVQVPALPSEYVYKHRFKLVPVEKDLFWLGSSFDWHYTDNLPTQNFLNKTEQYLKQFLKLPFAIVQHEASERPSSLDYKPFAGLHPSVPAVGILNGMGSKGFSQSPFFARQFADHLCNGTSLPAESDISRFRKILSRV